MIITGSIVGTSGLILSIIMSRGMNRSITNVLAGGFGAGDAAAGEAASVQAQAAARGVNMGDVETASEFTLGRTVVWARLRTREAGTAEVFDSDGNTLAYDSEDSARAALMDAEFVALDGLDAEDAAERGFALDELVPPAGDDTALRAQMVQKLPPHH